MRWFYSLFGKIFHTSSFKGHLRSKTSMKVRFLKEDGACLLHQYITLASSTAPAVAVASTAEAPAVASAKTAASASAYGVEHWSISLLCKPGLPSSAELASKNRSLDK